MFCTNCGKQVPDGAAFCTNCGTPVKAPTPNPAAETVVAAVPATDVTPEPATPAPATDVTPEPVAPTAGEAFVPPATAPVPPAATPTATTAMPPTVAPVPSRPYSPAGQAPAPKRGGKAKLVAIALLVILLAGAAGVAFVMLDPLGIMGTASHPAASEPATTSEAATTAATTEAATDEAPATTEPATKAATSAATTSAGTSASDYVIPDSATHTYTKQEIRDLGLTVDELWYARNEIYARHGRGFKDSALQSYFDSKPWYTREYSPEEFDSMADPLNSTEKANADAIKAVERDMGSSHL